MQLNCGDFEHVDGLEFERPNSGCRAAQMTQENTVLLVDDRIEARAAIGARLEEAGFEVVEAEDGIHGWKRFQETKPDLVVTDLRMPRSDGIQLLRRIREISSVPVVLITAYGDVPTAVTAMKGGAQEFFTFPDDLKALVERAMALVQSSHREAETEEIEGRITGKSEAMRRVRERIVGLAPLRVPILVAGEAGSGRSQVVSTLHLLGNGSRERIVLADPDEPRPLRRENESVFLDHVEHFPMDAQAFWFNQIQEMEHRENSIGRLYASTSRDLVEQATHGEFLTELAAQLVRFTVPLVPLRDRIDDLDQLVPLLVNQIGNAMGRDSIHVAPDALKALKAHAWPGNVRELAQTLERVIAFTNSGRVTEDQVEEILGQSQRNVRSLRERRTREQREELVALFEQCGGNIAEVARRLDLSRGAVTYRAQKFGLLPKPRGK